MKVTTTAGEYVLAESALLFLTHSLCTIHADAVSIAFGPGASLVYDFLPFCFYRLSGIKPHSEMRLCTSGSNLLRQFHADFMFLRASFAAALIVYLNLSRALDGAILIAIPRPICRLVQSLQNCICT
jgi:hypothetical protein